MYQRRWVSQETGPQEKSTYRPWGTLGTVRSRSVDRSSSKRCYRRSLGRLSTHTTQCTMKRTKWTINHVRSVDFIMHAQTSGKISRNILRDFHRGFFHEESNANRMPIHAPGIRSFQFNSIYNFLSGQNITLLQGPLHKRHFAELIHLRMFSLTDV